MNLGLLGLLGLLCLRGIMFIIIEQNLVYQVYLVYLALRAFGELRAMNFLDARLKFHAASLTVVLGLTISILVSRYGKGILEDNFVSR